MRILLIGEYSRLHNSLREGLEKSGHEVKIVGNGDGFKNFPVDYNIDATWCKSAPVAFFRKAIYKIAKFDIAAIEYGVRFKKLLPMLKDYDVVQLVSETPIQTTLSLEIKLLQKLGSQNRKMFALSSGTDYPFMKAAMGGKFRYSLADPYLKDKSLIEEYRHALKHLQPRYKDHHQNMLGLIDGIIATDIDYLIPLQGTEKFIGMIPNPVNTDIIRFKPSKISDEIVIFHGINRYNYHKKGNAFFEKALDIVKTKYGNRIRVITAETLPYDEYMKLYEQSHIVLDQIYAYDQGYNALEAMARGKVVFTGAEKEFAEYYGLAERVAVNALPDVGSIVDELSALIENPAEIAAIGKRAREFVEREHHYIAIANKYLQTWIGVNA